MKPELFIVAGKWLWDNYGKEFVDKALRDVKKRRESFNWSQAEGKYRSHMRKLHATTKVLNRDIKIQNMYTDVFVKDQISADTHLGARELQAHLIGQKSFSIELSRKSIKYVSMRSKRLFVLGKPGAGKTTFLKDVTLAACSGGSGKTPIFIGLKEWSDTNLEIIDFINKQFEVCSFPDSQSFVEWLLSKGGAIVLCDGLDEVDRKKRNFIISELEWFSKKYIDVRIYISCRLGAIDKFFEMYDYVEIADFDEKQINIFARKWFQGDDKKLAAFLSKLNSPDNQGLKELAQTPLLLALLCIVFEEIQEFPKKKIDLYMRAIDVLLEKWDARRGITRENEYFIMSRRRKENLLGYLAAINFEDGKFVFEKELLVDQIENFFLQLPEDETISANGETVLKTIQEHHGLILERSQNLYSFSHLSFQEYFTARYIVANAANGSVSRLISKYWNDDQWQEIFRMVFGLLDEGTSSVNYFVNYLNSMIRSEENLNLLFSSSNIKATKSHWNNITGRCMYSFLGLILISSRVPDSVSYAARSRDKLESFSYFFNETQEAKFIFKQLSAVALELSQRRRINLAQIQKISQHIGASILSQDLELDWNFTINDLALLEDYLQASVLLIDCLNTTRTSNREDVIRQILCI